MPKKDKSHVPPYPKKAHASGKARIRLGDRDVYLAGAWGSEESRADYDRVVASWLAVGRARPGEAERFTSEEAWARWQAHVERAYTKAGRATSTVDRSRQAGRGFVRVGPEYMDEWTTLHVKTLIRHWSAQGLARTTVNHYLSACRLAVRWLCEEGLCPASTWDAFRVVRPLAKGRGLAREADPVRPVPIEDVERTIPCLPPAVAAMVQLQLLTGMRPSEVCGMRGRDLTDLPSGAVRYDVPDEFNKTAHRGRARVVFLGPAAASLLKPWRATEGHLFRPAKGDKPRYWHQSYRIRVKAGCRRAGVPEWTPNRLRHTRATELRRLAGVDAARVVLGHGERATTEVYAERDLTLAEELALRFG